MFGAPRYDACFLIVELQFKKFSKIAGMPAEFKCGKFFVYVPVFGVLIGLPGSVFGLEGAVWSKPLPKAATIISPTRPQIEDL